MDTCNKLGEFTITGVERARKGEPKVFTCFFVAFADLNMATKALCTVAAATVWVVYGQSFTSLVGRAAYWGVFNARGLVCCHVRTTLVLAFCYVFTCLPCLQRASLLRKK